MQIDKKELDESLQFFDAAMNDIVSYPPESVNPMQLVTHYNKIKNVLALVLKENDE